MDLNKIRKKNVNKGPKVNINIKVSASASKWLKEHNYSPTGLFTEAMRELGYSEVEEAPQEEAPTQDPEASEPSEEPHPQSLEAAEQRKRAPVYTCECGYVDTENFVSCPKCEKIQKRDPQ